MPAPEENSSVGPLVQLTRRCCGPPQVTWESLSPKLMRLKSPSGWWMVADGVPSSTGAAVQPAQNIRRGRAPSIISRVKSDSTPVASRVVPSDDGTLSRAGGGPPQVAVW